MVTQTVFNRTDLLYVDSGPPAGLINITPMKMPGYQHENHFLLIHSDLNSYIPEEGSQKQGTQQSQACFCC